MRPSDIRQLRVEDIDWRQRKISFHQCKTRKPLILPLLPEVSQALIDYLRKGRPSTSFRNIFVRHKAPFEPVSSENSLSKILSKALHKSGLNQRLGRGGLSLLRHSLATRMLKANIPIKSIGDILGHVSIDSMSSFMKISPLFSRILVHPWLAIKLSIFYFINPPYPFLFPVNSLSR